MNRSRSLAGPDGLPRTSRVLIIDDSAVMRALLSRVIEAAPAFSVAAAFSGARCAIEWLKANPVDVILLDIEMPEVGGLAALPDLLKVSHGARVLIVSSSATEGAAASLRALALGATDTLAKPVAGSLGTRFAVELIERMVRLGQAADVSFAPPASTRSVAINPVGCLAIGASTGGLHALAAFFAGVPPGFDPPILVTQHLPAAFMSLFAGQLSAMAGRPADLAADGQPLERGRILIAPGEAHLTCVRRGGAVVAALPTHEVATRCRPSVDPMLESVGEAFGEAAVGVILSGMGRDGTAGAAVLADRGGSLFVQDPESAAVWGMPGSVARSGLAGMIAPPARLASAVARRGVA